MQKKKSEMKKKVSSNNKKIVNNKRAVKNTARAKKIIARLLKWTTLIILITGVIIFVLTTPIFNVNDIIVEGNQLVSSDEIISLSQIKLQENTFKNSKKEIINNIKENAYIENVQVKRMLPNKIQISVEERNVKYMIKILNSYAYISNHGYILEISDQAKEVPILEGLSTPEEEIQTGKRLNVDDLEKLKVVLKIQSICEENEISNLITSINMQNKNDYKIGMATKAKTAHLGNSTNLNTKILFIKVMLESEEGKSGEIFVDGDISDGFNPFFRENL